MAWGWTQGHLAEAMGTDQRTVSSWESGRHRPAKAVQAALARLFGMDLETLNGPAFTIPEPPLETTDRVAEHSGGSAQAVLELLPEIPEGAAAVRLGRKDLVLEALGPEGAQAALRKALAEGDQVWILVRRRT
jgi:transcriptional regulator with XRE-family HTH domain